MSNLNHITNAPLPRLWRTWEERAQKRHRNDENVCEKRILKIYLLSLQSRASFFSVFSRPLWCTLILVLSGCSVPSVKLETEKPLEVDIKMRVDIYQHPAPEVTSKKASAGNKEIATQQESRGTIPPDIARRNRMADIQEFKNSRLVGEGHDGLLTVLEKPPGEYGDYVSKVVAEENKDRMVLMSAQAEKEKRSLTDIQKQKAEEWRKRSFTGEWVEEPQVDGSYKWEQQR